MAKPIVEGTTTPLDFQLESDGVPVPGGLAGMTVELLLNRADGTAVNTTGKVTVPDPAAAKVRFNPAAGDLSVPPSAAETRYEARWKVTDGGGKVGYWPSGERDPWPIVRV